ncbi:MAG: redoxin family protein [Taibaiella sp.]|nr:redoxin family protein [Taibaiella sp.]
MAIFRFLFLSVFVFFSVLSPGATVTLSGIIKNKQADSVVVSYNNNRLAYYPVATAAKIDGQGHFSMKLSMPSAAPQFLQAELLHGDHVTEFFLKDGDSLFFSVDASRFDSSIHYSGQGADVQNFVAQHTLQRGRLNQYTSRIRNYMGLTPTSFSLSVAAEKNAEVIFLENFGERLPGDFKSFWLAHFTYYNYFFLQQYPMMHTAVELRRFTDTIPDSCYAVIKDVPLKFDDKLLSVPPYLLYLSGIFEARLKAAHFAFPTSEPANAERFIDSVTALAYTTLPNGSAEYFVAQNLYARIRHQLVSKTRSELDRFRKHWRESEYLPLLEKQLAITERLAAGAPAPDLVLVNDSGTRMNLSDLRGKVVYLSFWSTQCRQCVGEMRADRRIKDIFTNKPVVFAYVCIDEDSTLGQKLVKQFRLSGPFCWTSGGWYSNEAQDYGVQGMPAHFLIDREGKFAMQDPPAPAQKTELIVAISRLF